MPLETPDQWKAEMEPWMLEIVKDRTIPSSLEDCLKDEGWATIYYFFAKANYVTENLDFLAKVDEFGRNGNMDLAKQIYQEHVREGSAAQVNLSGGNRGALDDIFKDQDEPIGPPDLFDASRREIYGLTNTDSYTRFVRFATETQKVLGEEIDWDNVEGRDRS